MKSGIRTSVAMLLALSHVSHAYFACSLSNAVPLSSLLPSGGSTAGGGGGVTYTPTSPGCSFYIAAGGSCTTSKSKQKVKRSGSTNSDHLTTHRKRTYTTLPCSNTMSCVTVKDQLGCFDLNTYDYIDDEGTCGNLNTGEEETGCVAKFLAAQSSPASAIRVESTGTATPANSTASSLSAKTGASKSDGEALIPARSLLALLVSVLGLLMV
ncbi:hypothetical protein BT63DRAFT_429869 [Microthyrium microscopicum]|uniref:Uncharacterized protein n=1 Tax=Microthyrium microscopicum TaxID=703497 RepID=A0A6A6TZF1_9PEZI|nr:hypothetical protein BT63DRAFT_429869 [Microthyrium microscopicum]